MAIGQFFSQRFGYAVHALAYIAKKKPGELSTLPELADWMRTIWPNSSDSYLSNVVQRLARGGRGLGHIHQPGMFRGAVPEALLAIKRRHGKAVKFLAALEVHATHDVAGTGAGQVGLGVPGPRPLLPGGGQGQGERPPLPLGRWVRFATAASSG